MAQSDNNLPEGACSRREFLRRVSLAGLAAGALAAGGIALNNRKVRAKSDALRLPSYEVPPLADRPRIVAMRGDSVEAMLRACLERMGGIKRFIVPGDVVVLKPNVGFDRPPSIGATTNPEVVGAMARLCREAGAATVWVTDNAINDPERCMQISGVAKAAQANGARVFLPTPGAFQDVQEPSNEILKRWPFLYDPFRKATKVIGIPAAKQHSLAGATLGLKNWYGLLGGRRDRLHQDIHTSIADLGTLMKPTLTILDATRVLFRNGPTGGSLSDVREERCIAAATDPVALDTFGASLLGLKPEELAYLGLAQKRGLGTTDLKAAGFEMISGAQVGGGA